VFRRWTLAAASAALLLPAAASGESRTQCIQERVCLDVSWNEDQAILRAHTRLEVPTGVRVEFRQLENVQPVPRGRDPRVVEALVPPGGERQVAVLVRQDAYRPARFPFRWSFSYGDPHAVHDDSFAYHMPFGGREARPLTQGPNGSFSHKGRSAWSYDFAMPVGTPVLAARGGLVVERTDGYTKSGVSEDFLDRANAVTVLHDDGSFATYAHLDPGSGVREGMRVAVGDLLGFSGNTGFSTGPHLHFSVWKADYDGGRTIPIRFDVEGRPTAELVEGRSYAPTCHEGGRPCRPGELPAAPAPRARSADRQPDGSCRCRNGAVITTRLPCRAVCP
jgi:murein DD-endopeptidase MepM/ murein hydrolase activator NlpD